MTRFQHDVSRTFTLAGPGGIPLYMAPELHRDASKYRTTESTDVYAFGVLCFKLGSPDDEVFQRSSAKATTKNVFRPMRPTSMMHLTPDQTSFLWEVLTRTWSPYPTGRPSAAVLDHNLANLLAHLSDNQPLGCQQLSQISRRSSLFSVCGSAI